MDWWLLSEAAGRVYDLVASRGAPYNDDGFIRAIGAYNRDASAYLSDLRHASPEKVEEATCGVLRMLAASVRAYHRKKNVVVGANYMIPREPSPGLRERAESGRVIEGGRDLSAFEAFLETRLCTKPTNGLPDDLVLPVEKPGHADKLLFGAPKAFVSNEAEFVNRTTDVGQLVSGHPSQIVRHGIVEYFDRHRPHGLASFVSLPVVAPTGVAHSCPHSVLAVVNIHSNRNYVLGMFDGNRRKLLVVLELLLHILAQHIVVLDFPADRANPAPGTS